MKSLSVPIQKKTAEGYFPVIVFGLQDEDNENWYEKSLERFIHVGAYRRPSLYV